MLNADSAVYRLSPVATLKNVRVAGVFTKYGRTLTTWDATYRVPEMDGATGEQPEQPEQPAGATGTRLTLDSDTAGEPSPRLPAAPTTWSVVIATGGLRRDPNQVEARLVCLR